MARELYETESEFKADIDGSCELLRSKLGLDLLQILFPAKGKEAEAAKLLS